MKNCLIINMIYVTARRRSARLLSPRRALSAGKLSHSADYESTNYTFAILIYINDIERVKAISAPLHKISGIDIIEKKSRKHVTLHSFPVKVRLIKENI